MAKIVDELGIKYGRLLVVEYAGQNKHRSAEWVCLCDCGKETKVSGRNLRSGNTVSCGCHSIDTHTKHGAHTHPLYSIWKSMMRRCYSSKAKNYHNYGGRGIRVCDRWHDPLKFIQDMSPRPEGTSLDRVNNNGNYEPSNCAWATNDEQSRNRRNNRMVEYRGRVQTIADWAKEIGLPYQALYARLSKWPPEKAFTTPLRLSKTKGTGDGKKSA